VQDVQGQLRQGRLGQGHMGMVGRVESTAEQADAQGL
jgi:hypothetical protein